MLHSALFGLFVWWQNHVIERGVAGPNLKVDPNLNPGFFPLYYGDIRKKMTQIDTKLKRKS